MHLRAAWNAGARPTYYSCSSPLRRGSDNTRIELRERFVPLPGFDDRRENLCSAPPRTTYPPSVGESEVPACEGRRNSETEQRRPALPGAGRLRHMSEIASATAVE